MNIKDGIKKTSVLVALAVSGGMVSAASAGEARFETKGEQIVEKQIGGIKYALPSFAETGVRPLLGDYERKITGSRLAVVAKSLTPLGYQLISASDADFMDRKITWTGEGSVFDAWQSIAEANPDIHVRFDHQKRTFVIGKRPVVASDAVAKTTLPEISQEKIEVFAIHSGQDMASALNEWAARSGWQVVWEMPTNFNIKASVSFTGSFEQAASQLIAASVHGIPGIGATVYQGNKVFRVHPMEK